MKAGLLFLLISASVFGQNWLPLTSFPGLSRDDGVAVAIGNKAYVGSGLTSAWSYGSDFYCFDMISQSWGPIASMPAGSERQYATAFKGGQGFFVFGGDGIGGTLNSLFEYKLSTNSWSQKTSKPGSGIYGASCFVFGDTVIIAGGRFPGNLINHEVWMYRISSDSWQQLQNMPPEFGGRWRAAYATLYGKGYMLFGIDGNTNWRKELLEYDLQLDSWNKIMEVNTFPSLAYASMQSIGGSLVVFGGLDSLNNYSSTFHYFELSTYNWTQGPPFTATPRRGGMSWVYNNRFYYSCGLDENEQRINENWSLDVITSENQELNTNQFFVGPNPFSDKLWIKGRAHSMVQLLDLTGQLLLNLELSPGADLELKVERLNPGIYILKCTQGQKQIAVKKLIKH